MSKALDDLEAAWRLVCEDPHLFACSQLGFLPAGVPNPANRPQLEKWQSLHEASAPLRAG